MGLKVWESSVPQNSGTSTVRELALGVRWWQQRGEHVGVRYGWNYRNDWHFRRKGYRARRILKVGPWRKPLLQRVSSGPKGGTRGVCSFRVEILVALSSIQTLTLVDGEVSGTSGSFLCPRTSKENTFTWTYLLPRKQSFQSKQKVQQLRWLHCGDLPVTQPGLFGSFAWHGLFGSLTLCSLSHACSVKCSSTYGFMYCMSD